MRGVGESELPRLHGLKDQVVEWIQLVRSAMYPHIFTGERYKADLVEMQIVEYLQRAALLMHDMLRMVLPEGAEKAGEVVTAFFDALPGIAETLETDVQAAYDGDPAARSGEEIMLAYPAFEAISIYRLAHRAVRAEGAAPAAHDDRVRASQHGHRYPSRRHDRPVFLHRSRHGRGHRRDAASSASNVKLYQGVTLGAKSFPRWTRTATPSRASSAIRISSDRRRHLRRGDDPRRADVTIGENTVIGGNVWLTELRARRADGLQQHPAPGLRRLRLRPAEE